MCTPIPVVEAELIRAPLCNNCKCIWFRNSSREDGGKYSDEEGAKTLLTSTKDEEQLAAILKIKVGGTEIKAGRSS